MHQVNHVATTCLVTQHLLHDDYVEKYFVLAGGVLFAIELLLLTLNTFNVTMVSIATIVAVVTAQYLLGPDPAFDIKRLRQDSVNMVYLNKRFVDFCTFET